MNTNKKTIRKLEALLSQGYIELCSGVGTLEEAPRELKKYLAEYPESLILEIHRRPIGTIDRAVQYSGADITIYLDRKSYVRNRKR